MTIGSEIIYGILSSLVYDGLKRPFQGIADAVSRKKSINRALTQAPEPAPGSDIRAELGDLANVIGHDHGAYDNEVAEFLREIERSAIPDALKHFSMCGRDPEVAFPAFNLIYSSYSKLPFSSRALFDALNAAIRSRLQQGVEEKVLYEAIKANSGEILHRLESLAQCLENTRFLEVIPASQFAELRVKVAKGIEAANRQINVETTQGTKRVLITKLVIAPRLRAFSQKEILAAHRDAPNNRTPNIAYINFRRTFSRAVILGDPGGGKSTLTQMLCYDLANQIGLESSNPRHASFDTRDLMLPLRIVLRTLEKKQQKDPSYSIFDYIIDDIKVNCDNDQNLAAAFLKQSLALGEAVLLFDGLDEVLDVDGRRAMAAMIEQFAHAYATCPAVVTSRIVGYKDAPLTDDFSIYTLSRLDRDEVRKFAAQLIRVVTGLKKAEANERADTFISQTEKTATDLRENPLLLGLMVYIFNARGDVPNNRPEIYKECSMLMFEKWDQRRDIKFSFPQDFNLLDLFGYLASNIFGKAETEDGVSEEWLTSKLKEFFFSWYDQDRARSYEASKVLVEFITGRAWVMCDIGPHLFKFTHRTFLEYFFARRLEEEAGGTVSLLQAHLIPRAVKAEWDVVSHLALQISTFRSGVKSSQALDALLRHGYDARMSQGDEANYLTFVAKTLEYLIVPESKLREVVDYIFSRCVELGAKFSLRSVEIIHDLLRATLRRGSFVEKRLCELIEPVLTSPNSIKRSFALYLIGARFTSFGSGSMGELASPSERVWRAFTTSRARIREEQLRRAHQDVNEARTYIYVYRDNIVTLYERFRESLFGVRASEVTPPEIASLALLLFTSTIRRHGSPQFYYDLHIEMNAKEASHLIDMMAEDMLKAWRSGTIGELLNSSHFMAEELLEYILYRSEHDLRRAKGSQKSNLSPRETFLMLVFLSLPNSSRSLSRTSPKMNRLQKSSTLWQLVVNEWAVPGDEPYGQAIMEIVNSLRAEIGTSAPL